MATHKGKSCTCAHRSCRSHAHECFFLARLVHAHTPARGAAVPFCMRRRTKRARLRQRRMSLGPTQPPANLHYSMRPARLPSRSKSQFGVTGLGQKRAGEGLGMRYEQNAAGERLGDEVPAGEGLGTGGGAHITPWRPWHRRHRLRKPTWAPSRANTHCCEQSTRGPRGKEWPCAPATNCCR